MKVHQFWCRPKGSWAATQCRSPISQSGVGPSRKVESSVGSKGLRCWDIFQKLLTGFDSCWIMCCFYKRLACLPCVFAFLRFGTQLCGRDWMHTASEQLDMQRKFSSQATEFYWPRVFWILWIVTQETWFLQYVFGGGAFSSTFALDRSPPKSQDAKKELRGQGIELLAQELFVIATQNRLGGISTSGFYLFRYVSSL